MAETKYITGTTKQGFEFKIDVDLFDDWELVEILGEIDENKQSDRIYITLPFSYKVNINQKELWDIEELELLMGRLNQDIWLYKLYPKRVQTRIL